MAGQAFFYHDRFHLDEINLTALGFDAMRPIAIVTCTELAEAQAREEALKFD
jgi:hypothetical protein